jgi:hypothetical protein
MCCCPVLRTHDPRARARKISTRLTHSRAPSPPPPLCTQGMTSMTAMLNGVGSMYGHPHYDDNSGLDGGGGGVRVKAEGGQPHGRPPAHGGRPGGGGHGGGNGRALNGGRSSAGAPQSPSGGGSRRSDDGHESSRGGESPSMEHGHGQHHGHGHGGGGGYDHHGGMGGYDQHAQQHMGMPTMAMMAAHQHAAMHASAMHASYASGFNSTPGPTTGGTLMHGGGGRGMAVKGGGGGGGGHHMGGMGMPMPGDSAAAYHMAQAAFHGHPGAMHAAYHHHPQHAHMSGAGGLPVQYPYAPTGQFHDDQGAAAQFQGYQDDEDDEDEDIAQEGAQQGVDAGMMQRWHGEAGGRRGNGRGLAHNMGILSGARAPVLDNTHTHTTHTHSHTRTHTHHPRTHAPFPPPQR